MAAVILKVISSFHQNYSKDSVFIFAKTYENYILCKNYGNAHHDDKLLFLSNCGYHIVVILDIDELQEKRDAFTFIYQHVKCLLHHWYIDSAKNLLPWADKGLMIRREQKYFNQRKRVDQKMPSVAKKRLLREEYNWLLLSSLRKPKSTQMTASVFAVRTELIKKPKWQLESKDHVYCFETVIYYLSEKIPS